MDNEQKRLFFALWPDDSVREAIVAAVAPVLARAGGRPTPAANLHVTSLFLGNVRCAQLPALIAAAATVGPGQFSFELERIGYWYRNRLLWVAPGDGEGLAALAYALSRAAAKAGFEVEKRRYRPHMTLAREAAPVEHQRIEPIEWCVDHFVLVESQTGVRGSSYRIVERFDIR